MKILGIDTSCDDTAIALIEAKEGGFDILSNVVSSQVKLHAKYGGVYPFLAKREHQKNLPAVFKKAVKDPSKIDLIAVTSGPGLEPCLWQGINFAQEIAKKFKKPLIAVNHIEAHVLANWLAHKDIALPAICLVVSGGHTQIVLVRKPGQYQLIGETRDDAAGECLDKVARILGLGYPGGPAIAAEAVKLKTAPKLKVALPRPMMAQKNYDFSFSGLKTAVLYAFKKEKSKSQDFIRMMAAETQQAVIDVLIRKTLKAAKDFRAGSIILGGGVASNSELRRQFGDKIKKEAPGVSFYIPDSVFCTDNGAMIAAAAFYHKDEKVSEIEAEANLRI